MKRPLGLHRNTRGDNIEIGPRETICDDVDWIHLAQDQNQQQVLMKTVMKDQVQ